MNNLIVAKTSIKEAEMMAKVNLGASKFEIHLDKDFSETHIKELYDIAIKIYETLPDVVAVHTPLDNTRQFFDSDSVCLLKVVDNRSMRGALDKTCILSSLLGELYGHDIMVVTHVCESFDEARRRGTLLKLNRYVEALLKTYPNISIGLENVTPVEKVMAGQYKFRNGVLLDPVNLVDYLNKLDTSNNKVKFTNVLDICHMTITIRVYEALGLSVPKLKEMICAYARTCNYIHLANTEDLGINPSQHGTGFINDEESLLEIVTMLNEIMDEPTLCLEMQEASYLNPINAIHAKDYIRRL